MGARAPRLGRAVQAVGLALMPIALIWGMQTGDLGVELLGFAVAVLLILIGRSLAAPA